MSSHTVTLSAISLLNYEQISLISNHSSTHAERLLQSVLPSVRPSEKKKQLKNKGRDFCKILSSDVVTKFVEQFQFYLKSDDINVALRKNKLMFFELTTRLICT